MTTLYLFEATTLSFQDKAESGKWRISQVGAIMRAMPTDQEQTGMTTPLPLLSGGADTDNAADSTPESAAAGLTVKTGPDLARVQVSCQHQSGLIYAVPGDRSWVCSDELRPAHALSGFFRELIALDDPRVAGLMQQWGIYYRSLPLEVSENAAAADG